MIKKTYHTTKGLFGLSFVSILSCFFLYLFLFNVKNSLAQQRVEVLETDIGFDQAVSEDRPDLLEQKNEAKPASKLEGVRFEGEEFITVNLSLRRAIEENQRLKSENQDLQSELKSLRGRRAIEINRINSLTEEMRDVAVKTEAIVDLNRNYSRQIVNLRNTLSQKEGEYKLKIKELEDKMAQPAAWPQQLASARSPGQGPVRDMSAKKNVVQLLKKYNRENTRLKLDAAQVHYNMGNSFYHKGEYKKAVRKYKRALQLAPYDAAAHFNLAFVSAEYLEDYKTALKHYEEYLFLNPLAEDAPLVREKILEAQLELRARINSPIDMDKPF